ncbi:Transposable element Tc1 transposase [Anthophora plagiata]
MSPKISELSISRREKIILLRHEGESYRKIGEKLNINFSTVRYVIKKQEETGSIKNKRRSGRPKILSNRDRRQIIKQVSKEPFTSAQSITNQIAAISGKVVCAQTVRNGLHNVGLCGRTARKRPFINERNRLKRLEFAKAYVDKPLEFWKHVIFSDESKFNLSEADGKKFVWRRSNTEWQQKNLQTTVKHGGGHVMV